MMIQRYTFPKLTSNLPQFIHFYRNLRLKRRFRLHINDLLRGYIFFS